MFYVLLDKDEDKLTLEKITNEVSVVPAFRSQAGARSFMDRKISEDHSRRLSVVEFSISHFDAEQSWAERSGIALYIRLAD